MGDVLFLSPHNDDETLFGSFIIQRALSEGHDVHVVICITSLLQEMRGVTMPNGGLVTATVRSLETVAAMERLEVAGRPTGNKIYTNHWTGVDDSHREDHIEKYLIERFTELAKRDWVKVYAPASEPQGHIQHTIVGATAHRFLGTPERPLVRYMTYRRGLGKSRTEWQAVCQPQWVTAKLRALAEYRSQIEAPGAMSTPHFTADLHEYTEAYDE